MVCPHAEQTVERDKGCFRSSKHGFVRIGSAEEVVMSIAVQPIADGVSSSAFTFTIIVTIIISVFRHGHVLVQKLKKWGFRLKCADKKEA